jgi:hypothetical protein
MLQFEVETKSWGASCLTHLKIGVISILIETPVVALENIVDNFVKG